jgi:hypothetical protein
MAEADARRARASTLGRRERAGKGEGGCAGEDGVSAGEGAAPRPNRATAGASRAGACAPRRAAPSPGPRHGREGEGDAPRRGGTPGSRAMRTERRRAQGAAANAPGAETTGRGLAPRPRASTSGRAMARKGSSGTSQCEGR